MSGEVKQLNFGDGVAVTAPSVTTPADATISTPGLQHVYARQEANVAASVPTVSADTYVDSGVSLTLTEGFRYEVGYDVSVNLNWVSGTGVRSASVGIFNSVNVRSGASETIVAGLLDATSSGIVSPASKVIEIDVTVTETFKLRHRCSVDNTVAESSLVDQSITAGLTNPDNYSVMWARRISAL